VEFVRRMRLLVISALVWLAVCNFKGWGDPQVVVLAQSLLSTGNMAIAYVEKQIERKGRG
jgi:hypothetical protein